MANNWDEEQCVKYLAASLTGDAVYVLQQKPLGCWRYSELCASLEERYGLTGSAFINRSKLRRFQQNPGQSYQQLADEILKLVRCSFSGPAIEHEKIAVDYFIDAVRNQEVKRHLMQKEPNDVRSAVVLAKKFEEIMLATNTTLHNPRIYAATEEVGQMNPAEANKPPDVDALLEEVQKLRMRQAELEHRLSASENQNTFNNFNRFNYRGRGQGHYGGRGRGYLNGYQQRGAPN